MKLNRLEKNKSFTDVWGHGRFLWTKLRFYVSYAWRFIVLQRPEPLIYGVALTDRCNLRCQGCHIPENYRPDLSWSELTEKLQNAWDRGFRELYFSGGEPTLWSDGTQTLEDAIQIAKEIGFFHVHVYTNGLIGVNSSADLVWVSMDGLPETFNIRRGNHFYEVEQAIRASQHPKIAIIYVIDSLTAGGIDSFLEWVKVTNLPIIGVMFYFHTPYYGYDHLYLTKEQRSPIIDHLIQCVKKGLPVLNSRAGLLALKSGQWPRRFDVASVLDVDGESICCRAPDDICQDCGYAACTELTEFQRLKPSAVISMMRYW